MTALPTFSDVRLLSYIYREYLSRGMSYGDYLEYLCNSITEWSDLSDMAEIIGKSGLSLNDAVAYQGRLMRARHDARKFCVLEHNLRIVDFGRCANSITCWACFTRLYGSTDERLMYGPIR